MADKQDTPAAPAPSVRNTATQTEASVPVPKRAATITGKDLDAASAAHNTAPKDKEPGLVSQVAKTLAAPLAVVDKVATHLSGSDIHERLDKQDRWTKAINNLEEAARQLKNNESLRPIGDGLQKAPQRTVTPSERTLLIEGVNTARGPAAEKLARHTAARLAQVDGPGATPPFADEKLNRIYAASRPSPTTTRDQDRVADHVHGRAPQRELEIAR